MIAINQASKSEVGANNLFHKQTISFETVALSDEMAFNKIVGFYSSHLFSSAFYVTRNRQVSEDIVQETFLELWKKRTETPPDNLGGWLYGVVRNMAYKHLKREAYKTRINASLNMTIRPFYTEVEEQLMYKERIAALENVCKQLPEKQQKVYRLSREQGLSRYEIADHMNISSNTVKEHLSRAAHFIRKHVGAACLFIIILIFNNFFFKSSSTKSNLRELYKINRKIDKNISAKTVTAFVYKSSILSAKKFSKTKLFMTM